MKWGVERRLEFIESRLYWEGVMNRGDLVDAFGISTQQASGDLAKYAELAPGNLEYDRSRKGYYPGPGFEPKLITPDAGRYLAQLRLLGDGAVTAEDIGLSELPAFDVVPGPSRRIAPEVLRRTVAAIREQLAVEVLYQSMSKPDPTWRWIAPHALAFDGFRWHARAFCPVDRAYKDFVLARVREVRAARPAEDDPKTDRGWHERVRVIIGPHPGLSDGQKRAIEADYAMTGGVSVIDVRGCFLWYFLKRFGLDGDARAKRPQDQHVVVLNDEDVMTALVRVREGL